MAFTEVLIIRKGNISPSLPAAASPAVSGSDLRCHHRCPSPVYPHTLKEKDKRQAKDWLHYAANTSSLCAQLQKKGKI